MGSIIESRPEIGARLDHVAVQAAAPERTAARLGAILQATARPVSGGWRCEAPRRDVILVPGRANAVDHLAFAFASAAAVEGQRRRVIERGGAPVGPSPSSLFGREAFAVSDPDGNRVVFGVRSAAVPPQGMPEARLQHVGLRTAAIEPMLAFYRDALGFVESDRVVDEGGVLRAAFLRTDAEHHTVALFRAPEARLDHLSFDTTDVTAIRDWADHMARIEAPIFWGVGRHGPGNDIFFMVKDTEDNLVELSTELEVCGAERPAGVWPYTDRTLNLWGTAFRRS
jgi:catechol 2,3-dioxygenase